MVSAIRPKRGIAGCSGLIPSPSTAPRLPRSRVQCALSPGVPGFSIVGLPDKAVSEARERVRAALATMRIALPSQRITINLSPADMPKAGSHYDLPIALAILAALKVVPPRRRRNTRPLGSCRWTAS